MLATLAKSFHPCYLSNVEQEQMSVASVASVKWNAALEIKIEIGRPIKEKFTKLGIDFLSSDWSNSNPIQSLV